MLKVFRRGPGLACDSYPPSLFRLPAGIASQKVRVEEELAAYPTESVDLRCQFIDGGGRTKLTQVRAQKVWKQ